MDPGFTLKDMLDTFVIRLEDFQTFTSTLDERIHSDIKRLETDARQNAKTSRDEVDIIHKKLEKIAEELKQINTLITSVKSELEKNQNETKLKQMERDNTQQVQIESLKKDIQYSSGAVGAASGISTGIIANLPSIIDIFHNLLK